MFANNYIFNPGKNAVRFGLLEQQWEAHSHQSGMISIVGNVMQLEPSSSNTTLVNIGNGPCQVCLHDNLAGKQSAENASMLAGDSWKLTNRTTLSPGLTR